MRVVVSVDDPAGLDSLHDWLSGDPDIPVARRQGGELVVSVSGDGALAVLASALRGWVRRPRNATTAVTVGRDGQPAVEITTPAEIDGILASL